MRPLVVGFDLDFTLVDTHPGVAATFSELSRRTGVFIDAPLAAARLGATLEGELEHWFPAEQVPLVTDQFRSLYGEVAIETSPPLPGAVEAFAEVRSRSGGIVVITGKYEPNARLHLIHLGLVADAIVGWVWAETKVTAMTDHGVQLYVGDHPADMTAAGVAGAIAVGVLTGGHPRAALVDAGADVVLESLLEFPAWLSDHLDAAAVA